MFALPRFRRRHAIGLLAAIAAAGISQWVAATPVIQMAESLTRDLRLAHMARPMPAHKDIVLITVTEETMEAYPARSPIDRRLVAKIVKHADGHGAKIIGLDILLDRPTQPRDDQFLRRTLQSVNADLVLADLTAGQRPLDPEFFAAMSANVPRAPAEVLTPDIDGVTRVQHPFDQDGAPRTFAGQIASLAQIEKRPQGPITTAFMRGEGTPKVWPFNTYPANYFLEVPPEQGWMKDKIVLIGADMDDGDRFRTPLQSDPDVERDFPGVVIHAYQVAQLLSEQQVPVLPGWSHVLISFTTAGLGLFGLYKARSASRGVATLVLGPLAILLLSLFLYQALGVIAPVVAPVLSFVLASVGGGSLAANTHRADARRIDSAFRHYLDPKIVDTLMRRPARLPEASAQRDVAVLICDLEGFTAMTERADPATLGKLISPYFDTIISTIISHGGVIDKFTGDGALALFGAVTPDDLRREHATACALALDEACEAFRAQPAAQALAWGATRIGVHAGPALVGSFGGQKRLHFTALGRTVNLAARLEQANKALGQRVLISDDAAPQDMRERLRPVGRLKLRGAREPILAFSACPLGQDFSDYRAAYAHLNGDPLTARQAFATACQSAPDDLLARFHLRRLANGECGDEIIMG